MMMAAEKAGRALTRDFGEVENLQVSRKGPSDFVSVADTKAERIIRQELEKARPGYGFLMEESGATAGDGDRRWIVDPLDGTLNFLHGIPHFAISIALEERGSVIAGVVYQPLTDEMFWADRGEGAYLHDRRLRVSGRSSLGDSVIATGIPYRGHGDADSYIRELRSIMGEVAGVRRLGAAALDLAYVAAGRCDGFWETGLSAWDVAAGAIIVREAGGIVTDGQGRSATIESKSFVAANPDIHAPLLKLVSPA
ncbi:MAG: inositol monophosphatase [Pirellulales bacterium]|nr:inositol monophosphatase [Pirellulales bacterium]